MDFISETREFQVLGFQISVSLFELLSVVIVLFALHNITSILSREDEPAETINVPLPEAAEFGWKGEVLDDPDIKVHGLSAIRCYCPATGQLLGLVNPATQDGIDRAIAAAKEAQKAWAKTTFAQRRKVLKTLLNFILANQLPLARLCARDSGKPLLDASYGEILVTAAKLSWTIAHGEKALSPSRRPTSLLFSYKRNIVHYEPLGVVAALISWNYPLHNFFNPLITALFTGNALILKPSERTAYSTAYFLSLTRAALTACGHSPDLVHSLPMWPSTAPHLTSHPGISHITFIGSQPVAHSVVTSAAKSLTPVCAELGGKDPAILLDDISDKELNHVTATLMRGTFQAAGQNCIGIERIIALPHTYTRLVRLLEPKIRALRVGPPLESKNGEIDVGAMISSAGFDRLENLIQDAVARGAKLLVGGTRFTHSEWKKGHYFVPTLLVDVLPSMPIAQTELFAPVALLFRAKDVGNAIGLANSCAGSYSLGASVFGESKTDVDRVVKEVKAGMVAVNDFATFYPGQLPFGGVGGSGYGRMGGEEGLRGLCCLKSVCEDRWGGWGIRTRIPGVHRYNVVEGEKAWGVASGVVSLGYADFGGRVKGLWDVVRNM